MDHYDARSHTSQGNVRHLNVNVSLPGPEGMSLQDSRATCDTHGTFTLCDLLF